MSEEQPLIPGLWCPPPEPVPFPLADEIHLWRVRLGGVSERRWRALLTGEEIERAGRFRAAEDRHRFTVTRGVLRAALGQYLRAAPESLRFEHSRFGKPSLVPAQNPRGIGFNVSHSGDLSLLAFGLAPCLGVDVERVRPETDIHGLARGIFPPALCGRLLALPAAARRRAFFEAWARREAAAKALGGGLSLILGADEIGSAGAVGRWARNIEVDEGYAAAVAVRGSAQAFRLWDWVSRCGSPRTPGRKGRGAVTPG